MRDILKPHSGTPSGTDVSIPIMDYFDDFWCGVKIQNLGKVAIV